LCGFLNTPKCVSGRGSAPDPAGRAHDAPPDPVIGYGRETLPMPHATQDLWRLDLMERGIAPEIFLF